MIHEWILKQFDYIPRKVASEWIEAESKKRLKELNLLKAESLGQKEIQKRIRQIIGSDVGDVEPSDEKARKSYVAAASNFYQDILEKKMLQMVAQAREQLDSIWVDIPQGMTRSDYDNFIRGTSNAFKLLIDWGEQMKGENVSNITKETNE